MIQHLTAIAARLIAGKGTSFSHQPVPTIDTLPSAMPWLLFQGRVVTSQEQEPSGLFAFSLKSDQAFAWHCLDSSSTINDRSSYQQHMIADNRVFHFADDGRWAVGVRPFLDL